MSSILVILNLLLILCYAGATLWILSFFRSGSVVPGTLAFRTIGVGLLFHLLLLGTLAASRSPYVPQSPFEIALFFTAAGLIVSVLLRLSKRSDLFASGLALIFLVLTIMSPFLAGDPILIDPRLLTLTLTFHIGLVYLGVCFFFVAGAAGALYLAQKRMLTRKAALGWWTHLPSLERLIQWMDLFIGLGFVSISVGLVLGLSKAWHAWDGVLTDPKVWITGAIWAFYFICFVLTQLPGRSPKRTAVLSISGFLSFIILTVWVRWSGLTQHQYF